MEFLRKNVKEPIANLFKQGLTAENLSWYTANCRHHTNETGVLRLELLVVWCSFKHWPTLTFLQFPIPGVTTLVCLVFVFLFKLNVAACQLPNFLLTPVQLLTVVPQISLGNYLFGVEEDVTRIFTLLTSDIRSALVVGGYSILRGIVAWAILAPFFTIFVYKVLLYFVSKAMNKRP